MRVNGVERTLDKLGKALSTGDIAAVAQCWAVPSLVLSDEGVIAVSEMSQITALFTQAMTWYESQGLASTRPEIEQLEQLSESIFGVTVRWPAFDASGAEVTSERSQYLMVVGEDGEPRIRVALTRTT